MNKSSDELLGIIENELVDLSIKHEEEIDICETLRKMRSAIRHIIRIDKEVADERMRVRHATKKSKEVFDKLYEELQ